MKMRALSSQLGFSLFFQKSLWVFNFGHLFLSIFQNLIHFLEKNIQTIYIIFKVT